MHQQVVQGVEQRTQDQRDGRHPGQFATMQAEEVGGGGALCEIDDAPEVAEQRHLDQRDDQADQQQGEERRPDLAQVVGIETHHLGGRHAVGRGAEGVDQSFETTEEHGLLSSAIILGIGTSDWELAS
ncbi:hypothetical protein FQZ97_1168650 [compost metagenome]